jgi:hypothetical protein
VLDFLLVPVFLDWCGFLARECWVEVRRSRSLRRDCRELDTGSAEEDDTVQHRLHTGRATLIKHLLCVGSARQPLLPLHGE